MFQIPFIPSAAIAAVFISVCYSFSLSFSLSLFVSLSHAIPLQLSTCVSYSNHSYNCNTSPISPLLYICLPFSLSFTRSFTLLLQLSTYVSYSTHSHMSRVNSLSTLVCLKSSRNISTSSVTPPTRPPPTHCLRGFSWRWKLFIFTRFMRSSLSRHRSTNRAQITINHN